MASNYWITMDKKHWLGIAASFIECIGAFLLIVVLYAMFVYAYTMLTVEGHPVNVNCYALVDDSF